MLLLICHLLIFLLTYRHISGLHRLDSQGSQLPYNATAPGDRLLYEPSLLPLQRQDPLHLQEQHCLRLEPSGQVLDRRLAQCSKPQVCSWWGQAHLPVP